jgi:hypothetical protein
MRKLCSLLILIATLFVTINCTTESVIRTFGDITLPSSSFSVGKGFDIHYQFEKNNSITMGLIFQMPQRYFALGFGKRLMNCDMWIFEIFNDKLIMDDYFFLDNDRPYKDVELGGKNDLIPLGYQIRDEYVIVKLNRALNTNDKYDKVLKSGELDLIWAFGDDPATMTKSSEQGHFKVSLIKEDRLIDEEKEDRHGLLNLLCWGLLIDIGILTLRYLRLRRPSFDYRIPHAIIMATAGVISLYAASLMIYKNWNELNLGVFWRENPLRNYHMLFGLFAVIVVPIQALLGIATFKGVRFPNLRVIHMTIGYCVYILTKINILFGSIFHEDGKWFLPIFAYLSFVLFMHYRIRQMTKPLKEERSKVQ